MEGVFPAAHKANLLQPPAGTLSQDTKRRVSARVALALLEAVQSADIPLEQFKDEDVRITMPRRLGLSPVIERQIALCEDRVRRGRKMPDAELSELIGLMVKRPDATAVFLSAGTRLAAAWVRRVPRGLPWVTRRFLIRRRVLRSLRKLFGRKMGAFRGGSLVYEASATPFMQFDDRGRACAILTGFLQRVMSDNTAGTTQVAKEDCEAHGGRSCKWVTMPRTPDKA